MLLFADVKFLNVVNEFLLQAVLVVVHAFEFAQSVFQALANACHAALFVRFNLAQQAAYALNAGRKLDAQCCPLLGSELSEMRQRLGYSGAGCLPLLVGEFFSFGTLRHFGQAHQHLPQVVAGHGQPRALADGLHLLHITLHGVGIQRAGSLAARALRPEREVHFAAQQAVGNEAAYFNFFFPVERGDAGGKVKAFAVKRLDLYMNFLVAKGYVGFSVAGHGEYHRIMLIGS